MRTVTLLLLAIVVGVAPVAAGEKRPPKKPVKAMTAEERKAALKQAKELHARVKPLWLAGRHKEAEQLAREALVLRVRVLGRNHPLVAGTYLDLGAQLVPQGRLAEARGYYERCVRIWEKTLGPDHPHLAFGLNNLGQLLDGIGEHQVAQTLLERALRIYERADGPNHPNVAMAANNLASALEHQGRDEQARPLYERAVGIWVTAYGPEHRYVAAGLNNLASLFKNKQQYEQARPLLERALGIFEKRLGPEHPDVATSAHNLGYILRRLGERAEARELEERALRIREAALGPDHPAVAESLGCLALLCEAEGKYEPACEHLVRSLGIIERHLHRQFSGFTTSERLSLTRRLRVYLDDWLRIAPHAKRASYGEVLRFKGAVTRVLSAERRLARQTRTHSRDRVRELRAAEGRVARLANAMPPRFRRAEHKAWQAAYAKAGAERERLALALTRDFAPLRAGMERMDLSVSDIQSRLSPRAALVDVLRSGSRYLAWVVRPKAEPERLDLGAADEIEAAAQAFAAQAMDPLSTEWRKAGGALHRLVFSPIAKRLDQEVDTLYVCPDAALATLPFAALPEKDGDLVLHDRVRISCVSMAQDLVPWKDAPLPDSDCLLLGGVDYGEAAVGKHETFLLSPATYRAARGRNFGALPGTQAEVDVIRTGLEGLVHVLSGKAATENRLRNRAKGNRVLHLATHGFARDDLKRGLAPHKKIGTSRAASAARQLARGHDPMLLAGLALAGANPRKGGGGDDGIFTALEASHLDLDGCELVVLSACQTALGKAESGEGVIGLVQAFQMAGAQRVIGSLWKVDDHATQALMIKFYELWNPKDGGKGLGAAVALKKAQEYVRDFKDKNGKQKWKHPYYWAAWVLWGLPD